MATKRKTGKKTRKPAKKIKHHFSTLLFAFLTGALAVGIIWFMVDFNETPKPKGNLFSTKTVKTHFNFKNNSPLSSKITLNKASSVSQESAPEVPSSPQTLKSEKGYLVYLNSYPNFHRADNERAYLILRGFDAKVSKSTLLHEYLLWVGPFPSLETAYHIQVQLKTEYRQSRITTS